MSDRDSTQSTDRQTNDGHEGPGRDSAQTPGRRPLAARLWAPAHLSHSEQWLLRGGMALVIVAIVGLCLGRTDTALSALMASAAFNSAGASHRAWRERDNMFILRAITAMLFAWLAVFWYFA